MRVAVTGGHGFIGSAVMRQLEALGYESIVIDAHRGGVDVRDVVPLGAALDGADAVIHLAGVLGTDELFDTPQLAVDVNVTGTLNVLRACATYGVGYVGITMPDAFPSIYTATKLAATRLATAFHHSLGVPVSHVRAFNAYGPGQKHGPTHPRKIIPAFATEAYAGEPLTIWGDGTQTVDLIYVGDLARMLVHALDFGDDQVFDGGTGVATSVSMVAHWVNEFAGRDRDRVRHVPMRRGEIPTTIVAEGEGWEKLGWRPEFAISDLAETVRSYRPSRP